MNITDIIALAKAGYKKADIKELLEMETDNQHNISSDPTASQPEGVPTVEEVQKGTEQPATQTEPELDYKLLYEQQLQEINTLKDNLTAAQQANTRTNISSNVESPEDVLRNFFE